jgi:hypothetical protein
MPEKDKIKVEVRVPINMEKFKKIQKDKGMSYSDLLALFIKEGISKYEVR